MTEGRLLVLDIDDTIIPSQCTTKECENKHAKLVVDLLEYCEQQNIDIAINTARPAKSYSGIPRKIRKKIESKPFCYRPPGSINVPAHKTKCMLKLQGERKRKNVTLIDDRYENCRAVEKHGFGAIHVPSNGLGITEDNVKQFKLKMGQQR